MGLGAEDDIDLKISSALLCCTEIFPSASLDDVARLKKKLLSRRGYSNKLAVKLLVAPIRAFVYTQLPMY